MRSLRRQPVFSVSVVAILALGIGACTTMFSIIIAVFFDPLPYAEPERLAIIWHAQAWQHLRVATDDERSSSAGCSVTAPQATPGLKPRRSITGTPRNGPADGGTS